MEHIARRTWIGMAAAICVAAGIYAQVAPFPEARNLVQRVQEDLRKASEFAGGTPGIKKDRKQIERWENAQRNLSEFDKRLSKGKYDKGKLDHSISGVKDVVDHNTLSSADRDALNRDLADLRQFRAGHT